MLKDFIARRSVNRFGHREGCPFYNKEYYHELCAVLFPGWGRKHLKAKMEVKISPGSHCPCGVMSKRYVRRKARAFVAKK